MPHREDRIHPSPSGGAPYLSGSRQRSPDPDTVRVLRAIVKVALARPTFTAEDVREELQGMGFLVTTEPVDPGRRIHPNALGGGFRLARKTGLVEQIGLTHARHAGSRGRQIPVYRRAGTTATMPPVLAEQAGLLR